MEMPVAVPRGHKAAARGAKSERGSRYKMYWCCVDELGAVVVGGLIRLTVRCSKKFRYRSRAKFGTLWDGPVVAVCSLTANHMQRIINPSSVNSCSLFGSDWLLSLPSNISFDGCGWNSRTIQGRRCVCAVFFLRVYERQTRMGTVGIGE